MWRIFVPCEVGRGISQPQVQPQTHRRSPHSTARNPLHTHTPPPPTPHLQPNSDITSLFDDLLLLAAGRVAYGGAWDGALATFAAQGFTCPMYKNPTGWCMGWLLCVRTAEMCP